MRARHVLVLAGTSQARLLLARCGGAGVLASLAGRTEAPLPMAAPVRRGGFGGEAGFRAALRDATAVLDATHPFAARVTERAVRVCAEMQVPYLRLTRPGFGAVGERHVDAQACAGALPAGARVLLTTGPGSVAAFLDRGLRLWCRRVDPADPVPGVTWVVGRGPFTMTDERALLSESGITHLVTKDSGGDRTKLDAAAAEGVAVHVIEQPPSPGGEETYDIGRAVEFVKAHAP